MSFFGNDGHHMQDGFLLSSNYLILRGILRKDRKGFCYKLGITEPPFSKFAPKSENRGSIPYSCLPVSSCKAVLLLCQTLLLFSFLFGFYSPSRSLRVLRSYHPPAEKAWLAWHSPNRSSNSFHRENCCSNVMNLTIQWLRSCFIFQIFTELHYITTTYSLQI